VIPLYTASWREMANRHAEGDISIVPVRISLGKPKFSPIGASAPYVHELAPAGLLGLPPEEFEKGYAWRLHRYGVERIATRLEAIYTAYDRPLALVCFEAHRGDCHRDLAAVWLELHGLGPVPEVSPGAGKREPAQKDQMSTFGHVAQQLPRAHEPAQLSLIEEDQ
jgi:hypothetical protein